MTNLTAKDLPGLNCGVCGSKTCAELVGRLAADSTLIKRCIYLSGDMQAAAGLSSLPPVPAQVSCGADAAACPAAASVCPATRPAPATSGSFPAADWRDSLGREFDFYLEHFPEEPGPREIILPHNPMLTREMDIRVGEVLIGRPLGMSCGCPITHCGVAMNVDPRTGVIVWCVTGPLQPRQRGFKDLGYYVAEGYEGLIAQSRCDVKIGMRYCFQPRMCMLQWRHSGLVNFLNRTAEGLQVRLEGLWIG